MMRLASRKIALLAAALGATALPAEGTGDGARRDISLDVGACAIPPADAAARPAEGGAPVLVDGLGFAGIEADSDNGEARA